MGQIMKAVMVDLKGKAEGKVINDIVKKLCQ
ncbi:MAG: GatB/YqeY domain-containing protein [Eubacterium sp.]|nr:GatB/YqeY domain-containing protein [Eubacterium sp.]